MLWTLQGVAEHIVASLPVHGCFTSHALTCHHFGQAGYSHECHESLPDLILCKCVLTHSQLSHTSEDIQFYSSSYGWDSGDEWSQLMNAQFQCNIVAAKNYLSPLTIQTLVPCADAWIVLVW